MIFLEVLAYHKMKLSIFDLFKVGIGPSSSHTMGPMVAVYRFMKNCKISGKINNIQKIKVSVHGSLAWTGKGHGTDSAILLGMSGFTPEKVKPDNVKIILDSIYKNQFVKCFGYRINFNPSTDIVFDYKKIFDFHSNGIQITAYDDNKNIIEHRIYFSIGGGFVLAENEIEKAGLKENTVPHEFESCEELLNITQNYALSISEIIKANELSINPDVKIHDQIQLIWQTMNSCIERGLKISSNLPGDLNVSRRAPNLYDSLLKEGEPNNINIMDWVNVWAISVNEENASGGKIVTAPTNGAAGIIPAVIKYFDTFIKKNNKKCIEDFLLTAGAIGLLYKNNASISGAEVGCQGEVGVACSMAAGGLASAMGGTPQQIENAAEIGMEHNLGLTCDPVGGLVQIPCIERNAMGAVKAINAARIALKGNGEHMVSLDQVIQTMYETGKDMQSKYKETSKGGLAVNVVEC